MPASSTRVSLLTRIRNPADSASWFEFCSVYEPLLERYAICLGVRRADAPDIVQEILIRLLKKLDGFVYDPERGRFRNWLQRVAHNCIIDWIRVRSRQCEACCDPFILENVHASEFDWDAEYRRQVVMHVLEATRQECRSRTWLCFELHFLYRLPVSEIAQRTGLTVNGVYINAYRTLERVRRHCARFDEEIDYGPDVSLP